jgi:hypothetical protein
VNGAGTQLFCAWLEWCRFRVVVPLLDKMAPLVMAAIDQRPVRAATGLGLITGQ